MPIIEVSHVTKEFRLGQLYSARQALRRSLAKLRGRALEHSTPFKALDDVDFKVEPGEVLGIIGHNGAGKSTLLKLLAGITSATRGTLTVRGRVAPLIEVGAGLVPDLTGRENVFLNAAILGMKRGEIRRQFDDIVAFAELADFIDTPVKRYSSGMQMRLGFAIASSVPSEILIVDEVLAVGDLSFQQKCFERMEQIIRRQGRTVLMVSHNIRQVEQLATRVLLLDHGRVVMDGRPATVTSAFFDLVAKQTTTRSLSGTERAVAATDELVVEELQLLDAGNRPTKSICYLDPCRMRIRFRVLRPLRRICFFVGVRTSDFVGATSNETFPEPRDFAPGVYTLTLDVHRMPLLPGAYSFHIWIGSAEGVTKFDLDQMQPFQITSTDYSVMRQQGVGLIQLEVSWNLDASSVSNIERTRRPASAG